MPSWTTFLQILVLLAIAAFILTILSGFWHVLALLIVAIAAFSLWRNWPKAKK